MVTTLVSPPGPWVSRISDGASIVCDSKSHVTRGLGLPKSDKTSRIKMDKNTDAIFLTMALDCFERVALIANKHLANANKYLGNLWSFLGELWKLNGKSMGDRNKFVQK